MPLVEREKIWKTSFWNPDNAIASAINQRLSEHLGVLLLWAKRNTTASYQNYNTLAKMSSCTVDNSTKWFKVKCQFLIIESITNFHWNMKKDIERIIQKKFTFLLFYQSLKDMRKLMGNESTPIKKSWNLISNQSSPNSSISGFRIMVLKRWR